MDITDKEIAKSISLIINSKRRKILTIMKDGRLFTGPEFRDMLWEEWNKNPKLRGKSYYNVAKHFRILARNGLIALVDLGEENTKKKRPTKLYKITEKGTLIANLYLSIKPEVPKSPQKVIFEVQNQP